MRKVFFRGKRLDNGEWSYGYYTYCNETHTIHCTNEDGAPWWLVVDPTTIGQFSGLTDKNGTEIYEGDIVLYKNKKYVVKFQHGQFYASVHEFQPEIYGGFPLHALTINADKGEECEVIGNIQTIQ